MTITQKMAGRRIRTDDLRNNSPSLHRYAKLAFTGDWRSRSQCCHFVRDQILPWAFVLVLFYLWRPNSGLHEGTRTLPYYLVNRVLIKNEGLFRQKITQKSKKAVDRAVGLWVHSDCWLGAQMGSVLEPSTIAQRILFLSYWLHLAVFACVCDGYNLLRIL